MRLTLETTMMSGIQLILNTILLKETVRRNTGNIIYTAKGLTNHMSYLMIDPSNFLSCESLSGTCPSQLN
jgi:hypothetical protein